MIIMTVLGIEWYYCRLGLGQKLNPIKITLVFDLIDLKVQWFYKLPFFLYQSSIQWRVGGCLLWTGVKLFYFIWKPLILTILFVIVTRSSILTFNVACGAGILFWNIIIGDGKIWLDPNNLTSILYKSGGWFMDWRNTAHGKMGQLRIYPNYPRNIKMGRVRANQHIYTNLNSLVFNILYIWISFTTTKILEMDCAWARLLHVGSRAETQVGCGLCGVGTTDWPAMGVDWDYLTRFKRTGHIRVGLRPINHPGRLNPNSLVTPT